MTKRYLEAHEADALGRETAEDKHLVKVEQAYNLAAGWTEGCPGCGQNMTFFDKVTRIEGRCQACETEWGYDI